jgi:hypothetical protein
MAENYLNPGFLPGFLFNETLTILEVRFVLWQKDSIAFVFGRFDSGPVTITTKKQKQG